MRSPLVLLLLAAACAEPQPDDGDSAGPPAAAPADTLPSRFARRLVGTIGGDSVEVGLRLEEGSLSGWVAAPEADGRGFSGPLGAGGAVALEVWNQEGAVSDTLAGTLSGGAGGIALDGEIRGGGRAPLAVELREKRIALPSGAALVSRDLVVGDSAAGWDAYAQLPVLVPAAGAALAPAEAAFNEAVDDLLRGEIAAFGEHVEPPGDLPSDFAGRLSTFEAGYDVMLAAAGLLSLEFGVSVYNVGAAHPLYTTLTLTWDLTAGRAVGLAELFRRDADPLEILSRHAMAAVERNLGEFAENAWIAEGAGPDPAENYDRWTRTPEGVRVVFDPYQVAPYAAGPQVALVPWSALAWILDPSGPAARLAR